MPNIQPYNPQFNSLFTGMFANHNWASGIGMLGRGFAKPLELFDALNPGGSMPFTDPNGILRTAYQPRQEVTQQIASVTQSNANLILTWVDTGYNAFRLKTIIMDDNKNQGYVIAVGPGTATIQPATFPLILVSTTHFLAGGFATELSNAAGNHNSTGITGLYPALGDRLNYSAIMRESQQLSSREKFTTIKNDGDGDVENVYGFYDDEMYMVERFVKAKMWDALFSEPGQFHGIEGQTNRFEGARAATRNQGGRFVPQATLFTQADFEGDLDWMATNDPSQYQNFMFLMGRRAWARVNSFYAGDIGFTQSRAVIHGNELNFDVPTVTVNGVTARFLVTGIFDDRVKFPKISSVTGAGLQMSNTYFGLNLSGIPNKSGGVIPSVRKFHFADSKVTGGAETLYRYVPGMIGPGLSNSTGLPTMNGYQAAGSSIMGAGFEIAQDGGYDFAGDAFLWRELTA